MKHRFFIYCSVLLFASCIILSGCASKKGKVEYSEDGKRIIKLFSSREEYGFFITDEMIDDFNRDNKSYSVIVCEYDGSPISTFIQKETPDIMFEIDIKTIEDYISEGYLTDLWQYIGETGDLSSEDIYKGAASCFERDGKLYALPQYVAVRTLITKDDERPEHQGWTDSELLEWLADDAGFYTQLSFDHKQLLEYCLLGNMDSYIDFAKKEAHFNKPGYKELMDKIKNTEPVDADKELLLFASPNIPDEWRNSRFLGNANVSSLSQLVDERFCLGDSLTDRGFPNENRIPVYYLEPYVNLGIFETSDCKEGACEFLEYILTYPEKTQDKKDKKIRTMGYFWTVNRIREKEFKDSVGMHTLDIPGNEENTFKYEILESDIEFAEEILDSALPLSYERRMIMDIVEEEAQGYFEGDKNASEVINIINSRIELFLNE